MLRTAWRARTGRLQAAGLHPLQPVLPHARGSGGACGDGRAGHGRGPVSGLPAAQGGWVRTLADVALLWRPKGIARLSLSGGAAAMGEERRIAAAGYGILPRSEGKDLRAATNSRTVC